MGVDNNSEKLFSQIEQQKSEKGSEKSKRVLEGIKQEIEDNGMAVNDWFEKLDPALQEEDPQIDEIIFYSVDRVRQKSKYNLPEREN